MKKRKAFTLIELLVVIAIIGILASIVLVSLRGATKKAKDARITSDLTQVRSIAEMIYSDENGYTKLCDGSGALGGGGSNYDTQLSSIDSDVSAQGGSATCYADADNYCVYSALNATGAGYYCIDSTGKAGKTTTDPSGTGYCDGTTYVCP